MWRPRTGGSIICLMATDKERVRQELAQAKEHVIQGRRIVEAQRERTAKMRADGHSITTHEQIAQAIRANPTGV